MPDTFVVLGQRGGTPSPLHSRRLAQRIHKVRQVLVCVLVAFDQELRLLSEDLQAPSYLQVTGLRRVKKISTSSSTSVIRSVGTAASTSRPVVAFRVAAWPRSKGNTIPRHRLPAVWYSASNVGTSLGIALPMQGR